MAEYKVETIGGPLPVRVLEDGKLVALCCDKETARKIAGKSKSKDDPKPPKNEK